MAICCSSFLELASGNSTTSRCPRNISLVGWRHNCRSWLLLNFMRKDVFRSVLERRNIWVTGNWRSIQKYTKCMKNSPITCNPPSSGLIYRWQKVMAHLVLAIFLRLSRPTYIFNPSMKVRFNSSNCCVIVAFYYKSLAHMTEEKTGNTFTTLLLLLHELKAFFSLSQLLSVTTFA